MFTEKNTVQKPLIKYAVDAGWEYISTSEALSLRGGESGMLFSDILADKLKKFNPGLITGENVNDVIRRIESERNTIEGNASILSWLRGEKSIYDHKEKRERNVALIDYEKIKNNIFQVTEEWQFTNGRETNRSDIIFLINGIPVAIVESKNAKKPDGIEKALVQIREYHRETPEMVTSAQVFNITHLIDFMYGVTWNLDCKNVFSWKSANDERVGAPLQRGTGRGENGISQNFDSFESKVKSFFDRGRFLMMLREWILFYYKDDELRKTVLRQHQTRAVDKILERCSDEARKTGLIWHTQGSGKTFTMITAARLILREKDLFGKPTVILMIDRNELEGQLSGWVGRLLGEMQAHDIKIESANSKKKLRSLLESDFRGLVVSMIHKFDGISKDVNKRDNIFVLIDEAHRSIGGDLGNYLVAALPSATMIGFTGTPIDKTAYGKGTFKIFGREDDKGYLDKYSISESIDDGTTLPLKYALAPNEIRVPREQLEKEFLSLAEAEGICDIDVLNKILDHALKLKNFLKSKDRIAKVAKFVAKHYRENVEPMGYKAFLVGVDREACALYKEELDKLLPPEYSMPIYSSAQHDGERFPFVYKHQVGAEAEKMVRKQFLKPDTLPKIFIVTDKLLTGFDAPILYCMYLDKPMRDHVLLQAIARVNRPYEINEKKRKPCGLVVDFVGIFEKLEKALAFDSDVVGGAIEGIDILLARFHDLMAKDAKKYLVLCDGSLDDKTVEKIVELFSDKSEREDFFRLYKQLETIYDILSPSPDLRDHMDDFAKLSAMFQIIGNAFSRKTVLYGDVAGKTEHLIRENISVFGLENALPAVVIDDKTLDAIRISGKSDKGKIINLVIGIRKKVTDEGDNAPYLHEIGDRAEAIIEAFDDRQISTESALKRIEDIVKEMLAARKERELSGLDSDTFGIFWKLKSEKMEEPAKNAAIVKSMVERFPNSKDNPEELRQLKAELYKFLFPLVGKEKMIQIVERLLR